MGGRPSRRAAGSWTAKTRPLSRKAQQLPCRSHNHLATHGAKFYCSCGHTTGNGGVVVIAYSPPTKANRVRFLPGEGGAPGRSYVGIMPDYARWLAGFLGGIPLRKKSFHKLDFQNVKQEHVLYVAKGVTEEIWVALNSEVVRADAKGTSTSRYRLAPYPLGTLGLSFNRSCRERIPGTNGLRAVRTGVHSETGTLSQVSKAVSTFGSSCGRGRVRNSASSDVTLTRSEYGLQCVVRTVFVDGVEAMVYRGNRQFDPTALCTAVLMCHMSQACTALTNIVATFKVIAALFVFPPALSRAPSRLSVALCFLRIRVGDDKVLLAHSHLHCRTSEDRTLACERPVYIGGCTTEFPKVRLATVRNKATSIQLLQRARPDEQPVSVEFGVYTRTVDWLFLPARAVGCFTSTVMCRAVRLLASHQGEPGSIPGRVTPGFPQVRIVSDDASDMQVYSGVFRFPRSSITAPLRSHLISP
ncbi:hypothetical protein PR048_017515 [Dryococelus australis]|uniref:Uncharacterized protein n=1 Tax=Dryococelus australis TaxID=614101 RepID=A0ABQ9H9R0_9NEOP|nr:hypothetical protein PR048_017515 [Dryococelus australis]